MTRREYTLATIALLSLVVLALYLWRDRALFHNHYQAVSDAKDKAVEQDERLKDLLQRDSTDVERANNAEEALKEAQRLPDTEVTPPGERTARMAAARVDREDEGSFSRCSQPI